MRHQPHLYLPGPWSGDRIAPAPQAIHHLTTVLRYDPGDRITYTDGAGNLGSGTWTGDAVQRADERSVPRQGRMVDIAVAAPRAKERQRFIVEKCQELGVRSLIWLTTVRGGHRPPPSDKAASWAVGALEQSRGAWVMRIEGPDPVEAHGDAWAADIEAPLAATSMPGGPVKIAIGPEGGFTDDELGSFAGRVSLGWSVLRTDSAAIVAAGVLRLL